MTFKGKTSWVRLRGIPTPDRFLYVQRKDPGFNPVAWRWAYLLISTPDVCLDEQHLLKLWRIYLEKLLLYAKEENEAITQMGFAEFWWLVEYGPAILED